MIEVFFFPLGKVTFVVNASRLGGLTSGGLGGRDGGDEIIGAGSLADRRGRKQVLVCNPRDHSHLQAWLAQTDAGGASSSQDKAGASALTVVTRCRWNQVSEHPKGISEGRKAQAGTLLPEARVDFGFAPTVQQVSRLNEKLWGRT